MVEEEYEVVETEYDNSKSITISDGPNSKAVQVPPDLLDRWDDMANDMEISRSELVRLLTTVGINTLDQYDPTHGSQQNNQSDPLSNVILDHVEIGDDSAKSLDDIADDIADSVLKQGLNVLFSADNVREDKNQFYKV